MEVDEDARPSFNDLAEHFEQVIRLEAERAEEAMRKANEPQAGPKRLETSRFSNVFHGFARFLMLFQCSFQWF